MLRQMFIQKMAGSIVRHGLTVAGGWLLAEGYTDEQTWATVTGGITAATGIAFSIFEKKWRF
ncbi:hypothetical protein [Rhodophyticola sp.]|uniref:Pam3-gp28 family putative phage holin n=1 Tax=Rhodophyticola sp. TaxID=2680032 RepID=UPI003D2A939E